MGIGIGVMALILVIAVMTGAQDEFRDRILGTNPHILISSIEGEIRNPDEVVKKVEGVEGVESASPFITLQAMAQGPSRMAGTVVKGIRAQGYGSVGRFIKEGSADSLEQKGTILVGKELARTWGSSRATASPSSSPMQVFLRPAQCLKRSGSGWAPYSRQACSRSTAL